MQPVRPDRSDDLLAFGEKILAILDRGSFTSTYKYAVLLGLLDLALEKTQRDGTPPQMVTTRELAARVIELYWPHTNCFPATQRILGQNLPQKDKGDQAEIVRLIETFRRKDAQRATLHRARLRSPAAWAKLLVEVEWKLVEMPLPRLQQVGDCSSPFLYVIPWDRSIKRTQFKSSHFDNRIHFLPGTTEHLVRLAGLLRPLIQREWSSMIARFNQLPSMKLEEFLFGSDRSALTAVRSPLFHLQAARCFYCAGKATLDEIEVDHFVPWARHPNNSIENLVAAHARCNESKSDYLAAPMHLSRWLRRLQDEQAALSQISQHAMWESEPDTSLAVTRGIYLRLPEATQLWERTRRFTSSSRVELVTLLAA